MSWKIYALGNAMKASDTGELVVSKLNALGYTASLSNASTYSCNLAVTIDGVNSTFMLQIKEQNLVPVFLCVNDETNSIVVSRYDSSLDPGTYLCNTACFMMVSGTDILTGIKGRYGVVNSGYEPTQYTNYWFPRTEDDVVFLFKAVFRKYSTYNVHSFETDDIYWGSISLTPGAVITVGGESFVCLNFNLFAKL